MMLAVELIDWSFFTEEEKHAWAKRTSPEGIVHFINSMQRNKLGAFDRLDKALAEVALLREQIRKMPCLFACAETRI